ncbi:hypothetical protein JW899_00930 [Candidatus Uhrbacteria bacterium]|nr:hypothetical protein [Candidatus Uhrbacteria bacterium]
MSIVRIIFTVLGLAVLAVSAMVLPGMLGELWNSDIRVIGVGWAVLTLTTGLGLLTLAVFGWRYLKPTAIIMVGGAFFCISTYLTVFLRGYFG